MTTILGLGAFVGLAGVCVFGAIAIAKRGDPIARRRWNGWLLGSFALGMVCIAPFVFGFI